MKPWVWTGALGLAFAVLVLTKPISQDEGVFLAIGKYLSRGAVIYQDVFDHKPPGIHFLLAGLFAVFGSSLWVAKAALLASVAGAVALVKAIADQLRPGTGWTAAAICVFLLTQFEGYYLIAEPLLLLPLLLGGWLLLRRPNKAPVLFMAGLSFGVAALFKQTAVLSVAPMIFLLGRAAWSSWAALLAGVVSPLLVTGAYVFLNDAIEPAWRQVVELTLTSYPAEPFGYVLRNLGWSFLWTLPVWLLFLARPTDRLANKRVLWALVLLPLPFMFIRHYPHYWVPVLPFVAILAAINLANRRSRTWVIGLMLFCLSIAAGKVGRDVAPNWQKLQAQISLAADLRDVPADAILAENQFTAFYFLLPQRPLNKYLYLTEITDAENGQTRTINDLTAISKVIIFWPEPSYAYAKRVEAAVGSLGLAATDFPNLALRVWRSP